MNNWMTYIKGDKVIWMIVVLLSIFSTLAVYSSISTLAYKSGLGKQEIILVKHGATVLMGLGFIYVIHLMKYKYFSRLGQIFIIVAIPLLLLTLVMGTNLNQASRWLVIPGLGISFQTSDFAKIALIMYVSRLLSKKQDDIGDLKRTFLPILAVIGAVCLLILPANFSTAALLFVTCTILMFIAKVPLKYLFSLFAIAVVSFGIFVAVVLNTGTDNRVSTWVNRIVNFTNKENQKAGASYQVDQAKIAIATGGVVGKGPGGSTQRNFLPHPYSDFIYAFIIEEYGLIGGFFVLFLYLLLFFRVIRIAAKVDDPFAVFLVMGAGIMLVFQALINMAVSVNLVPVTGQPLPFISKGGTSFIFTGIALGIILSISRSLSENSENEKVTAKGNNIKNNSQDEKGGKYVAA